MDRTDIDRLIATADDFRARTNPATMGSRDRLAWALRVLAGNAPADATRRDCATEIVRRATTPGTCLQTGADVDPSPGPDAANEAPWPRDAALIVEFWATVSMAATWLAGQVNAADPHAATIRRNVIRHAGEHRVRTEPTKAEQRRRRIALAWTQPLAVQS